MQHGQHTVDGRGLEVKAARPKTHGSSARASKKLFVGGLPVRPAPRFILAAW